MDQQQYRRDGSGLMLPANMAGTKNDAAAYRDLQGKPYAFAAARGTPTTISVLPLFEVLKGAPWDERALAVLQAVAPSAVRVVDQNSKLVGFSPRRVTVFVDGDNRIVNLIQEVIIPLPEGVQNAAVMLQSVARDNNQDTKFTGPPPPIDEGQNFARNHAKVSLQDLFSLFDTGSRMDPRQEHRKEAVRTLAKQLVPDIDLEELT